MDIASTLDQIGLLSSLHLTDVYDLVTTQRHT